MSAQVVSKKHIDVLVYARSIPSFWNVPENEIDSTQLGQMLWRENMLSLQARYGNIIDEETLQTYSYIEPKILPVITIIKSFNCYEYQSCEHEGWKKSAAYRYYKAVSRGLISCLPGYDEAPWGID